MNENKKNQFLPTVNDVEQFEMILPMLLADLEEMRVLSKKKQAGIVNTLKVKTINKKLEKIRSLLSSEPTIEFLQLLDYEPLPFNSDAVLIMVQYKTAMEQYKSKYFTRDSSDFDIVDDHYSWKTSK